jgi:pimeloyl-ACP methyl ester carboxylesterase
MPFIKTSDGTSLFYSDGSEGKPIILIHGWAMGSDMWEYQVPHLTASGLRCIVYDQRGCHRSDQPAHGYDFDTLAADLAEVLGHLDLREVTLVGYSLGGGVIARYLARYGSDRIAQSILVASNTPCLLKTPKNLEGLDRSVVYDGFLAGLQTDRPHLLATTAPAFFGAGPDGVSVSQEIMQWGVGLCHRSSPKGMLDLYRAVNHTDFRPDMAAFTMPTLIIHGDADPFMPIEVSGRRTAQAIPGSQLEVYEGASHGLFFTHKDRLNSDLLAFVKTADVARHA